MLKQPIQRLADYNHPKVQETALKLVQNKIDVREKIQQIFNFVRDEIKFGFPIEGDWTTASKTLETKIGQCNTKGTLFLALCKAAGIPARIHFSLIKREIQRGIFPEFLYILLPKKLSHSWIEVEVTGKWVRIDGYINDLIFFRGAKNKLSEKKWDTGFSIAGNNESLSPELNFEQEKFEQMHAVTEDHGTWDDPIKYYQSNLYRNRPNIFKEILYRIFIPYVNARINKIRH